MEWLIIGIPIVVVGGTIIYRMLPAGCIIPEDCATCITEPCQSREDFPRG